MGPVGSLIPGPSQAGPLSYSTLHTDKRERAWYVKSHKQRHMLREGLSLEVTCVGAISAVYTYALWYICQTHTSLQPRQYQGVFMARKYLAGYGNYVYYTTYIMLRDFELLHFVS